MESSPVLIFARSLSTVLLILSITGCGSGSGPVSEVKGNAESPTDPLSASTGSSAGEDASGLSEEHPHKPGTHGGIIIPIGSDSYHAEAVVDKDGSLRLMMLGRDESRIQEVEVQPVRAFVKAVGDPDSTAMELAAIPQEGDGPGMTSQFVGQLPSGVRGKPLDVTIPNLRISGERFRIGFTTVTELHDAGMPSSLPADEERQLYLTPGGKYTEADIQANGRMTAAQKFRGVISKHDARPVPGDRVCPISMTKANPDFTWIINGKPYQFCCPPCVDEFVKAAKERPEELQEPDTYIKSADVPKP